MYWQAFVTRLLCTNILKYKASFLAKVKVANRTAQSHNFVESFKMTAGLRSGQVFTTKETLVPLPHNSALIKQPTLQASDFTDSIITTVSREFTPNASQSFLTSPQKLNITNHQQFLKNRGQRTLPDYLRECASINARQTFACTFPEDIDDQKAISIGKFRLNRTFNYLRPVVQSLIAVQAPSEPEGARNVRPMILVVVLGKRNSVEHVFRLASDACEQTWVKPAFLSEYYTFGDCDAMLLVATPTALIETARHQAIFLSQVQHLIIDDGDALHRGNSDHKAIYDINRFFPDLPSDCLRSLFTVVPSPYSISLANVLTQDYAFITVSDIFKCLDLTIRDMWESESAAPSSFEQELPSGPVRTPTVIYVPSYETAGMLQHFLTQSNIVCYTPEPPQDFDEDPQFEALPQTQRWEVLLHYQKQRDEQLFEMVERFNSSESDFLILTKDTAEYLFTMSQQPAETHRPVRRRVPSLRQPQEKSFWKRVRASFTAITPLEPEPDTASEPVAPFVVPDWTRAKLESEKMIINYDSHDTTFDLFATYGVNFDIQGDHGNLSARP